MIEIAPRSENAMTYDEAILYCQFLDYKGHTDWRMPTLDETIRHHGWYVDSKSKLLWGVSPVRDI
jgi:hypothetical protein